MKAFCLYIAAGAILVNITGNFFASTAEGIAQARNERIERLCRVNPIYCD